MVPADYTEGVEMVETAVLGLKEHFIAEFSIDFKIELSITNSAMNSDPLIH